MGPSTSMDKVCGLGMELSRRFRAGDDVGHLSTVEHSNHGADQQRSSWAYKF